MNGESTIPNKFIKDDFDDFLSPNVLFLLFGNHNCWASRLTSFWWSSCCRHILFYRTRDWAKPSFSSARASMTQAKNQFFLSFSLYLFFLFKLSSLFIFSTELIEIPSISFKRSLTLWRGTTEPRFSLSTELITLNINCFSFEEYSHPLGMISVCINRIVRAKWFECVTWDRIQFGWTRIMQWEAAQEHLDIY